MSDWQTDSGLFSDYTGTVTDAWFQTDPNVGDGKVFQLYLEMGDLDVPAPDGKGEWIERFSCGPDWMSNDGGKTVSHPSKNLFNKNSQVGRLVDRLVELADVEQLGTRGSEKSGGTYLGMRMHMEGVTTKGTFRQGANKGEAWESTRNFPTSLEFVEVGAEGSGASTTNGHAKPSVKDGAAWVDYLPADILSQIKSRAEMVASAMDLCNACLDIPGLSDDNDLVVALAEDGPASLFAVLKG